MDKARINYWVDIAAAISFIISAFTGLIIFFFMPQGPRSGQLSFWGAIKGTWTTWHNWSGIVFIALVIVHIILHWNWLVCMTRGLFKKKSCKK